MNDQDNHNDRELELSAALDRWGSNLDSWPTSAREQAKRLLGSSPEAIHLMRESAALETALAELREHRATPGLNNRILGQLPTRDGLQRMVDWLTGALWRPALAAAVPLALGFILGTMIPEEDSQLADELSLLVFSSTYEELEDDS